MYHNESEQETSEKFTNNIMGLLRTHCHNMSSMNYPSEKQGKIMEFFSELFSLSKQNINQLKVSDNKSFLIIDFSLIFSSSYALFRKILML